MRTVVSRRTSTNRFLSTSPHVVATYNDGADLVIRRATRTGLSNQRNVVVSHLARLTPLVLGAVIFSAIGLA